MEKGGWRHEGLEKGKAPLAQILLAPLLYPTITQRPLDHLWDLLGRTEEDTTDSALVGPKKSDVEVK